MIDLLRSRRSIRAYTDDPIEAEKVELLVEALLRAPSSHNHRAWEFVIVDERALLDQLARAREHGSGFLAAAPLAVVVCGDPDRSDVWVEDCAIAAILAQLTAHSLGLGSCWVQIRCRPHDDAVSAEDFVREVLGLPPHLTVAAILGVGYPAETRPPVPRDRLDRHKVHRNRHP